MTGDAMAGAAPSVGGAPSDTVGRMSERRHWDPQPGDGERIREHLERQRDLDPRFVRLDDGRVVPVGEDAQDER